MIYKNKSSKYIINKVYRDLNLKDTDRWMDMIEWIGECLSSIGEFNQYKRYAKQLTIANGKAVLPSNFYKLVQVSYNGRPLLPASGSFTNLLCPTDTNTLSQSIIDLGGNDISENAILDSNTPSNTFRYSIDDCYIKTEFKDGTIYIAYVGLPIDDEGFPLVPDDIAFDNACFWYIVSKLVLGGYSFPDKNMNYMFCEIKANNAIKGARGASAMPDLDQMENIKKMWLRIIPEIERHSSFFNNLTTEESQRL